MDAISYKCPNCGGDLKFDPKSGGYACEYCLSKFTQEDLDAQQKQTEKKTAAKEETAGEGQVFTCPSCGATIVTDSTTAATFCYYCHNPVVLSGRLSGKDMPDYVLPFKIDRKQALEIFENWMKAHKYVPAAFYSKDQIEKFSGVYFPYHLYSCKVKGDVDIQADKVSVRTEGTMEYTETATYHVVRDGSMDIKYIFRNALNKANKVLADCVQPFDTAELKPFNMGYLSGFMAEKKDLENSQYAAEIEDEVKDFAVSSLTASLAEYENVDISTKNLKVTDGEWKYALMPVWTLTYQEGGKTWYFSINGQSGKTVGELPVDKKKLLLSALTIFVPFAAALLALFYFVF